METRQRHDPIVPFVRFSKDMQFAELCVGGVLIDRMRITIGADHHKIKEAMRRRARDVHRIPMDKRTVV